MSTSPYEQLRLHGAVRSAIIVYGIAALSYLMPRSVAAGSPGVVSMLVTGIALQLLAWVLRRFVSRYERAAGIDGYLSPLAIFIFDLVVDAVTVLLFALATYRAISHAPDEI